MITGTFTNENNVAIVKNLKNISTIHVSHLGYDDIVIHYVDSVDYSVKMSRGSVMENKLIVFKINEIKSNTLNLTLLSKDYNIKDLSDRELRKLEKKIIKSKNRERFYIKQE